MALPRGLRALLKQTSPGKLTKGHYKGYRAIDAHGAFEGPTLRGITKRLHAKLYSNGELHESSTASTEWTPGAWQGNDGGLRRGRAVDTQVSRLAGAGEGARGKASKFKFTTMAFSALERAGLQPVLGQRVVLSRAHGIATAADMICYSEATKSLVVVELKCGFSGNRTIPATFKGKHQKMKTPCNGADDCILNRHIAQLAATRHLLTTETRLMSQLKTKFAISDIRGCLLYVCDRDTQLHELGKWWRNRGGALIEALSTD
jgi:hypothetical protein